MKVFAVAVPKIIDKRKHPIKHWKTVKFVRSLVGLICIHVAEEAYMVLAFGTLPHAETAVSRIKACGNACGQYIMGGEYTYSDNCLKITEMIEKV